MAQVDYLTDKRTSWSGLDASVSLLGHEDRTRSQDSTSSENVADDPGNNVEADPLNDPEDRRSSWGDLDSLVGQFAQMNGASAAPDLDSIREEKDDLRSVKSSRSRSPKGSPKPSKGDRVRDKLRRKINQSRRAHIAE
jgi:hypothetical protein